MRSVKRCLSLLVISGFLVALPIPLAFGHLDTQDDPEVIMTVTVRGAGFGSVSPESPTTIFDQFPDKDSWTVNCSWGDRAEFDIRVAEGEFAFTVRGSKQSGGTFKKHTHWICEGQAICNLTMGAAVGSNRRIERGIVSSNDYADIERGRCIRTPISTDP